MRGRWCVAVFVAAAGCSWFGYGGGLSELPILVPAPQIATVMGGVSTRTNVTRVTRADLPAEGYNLAVTQRGVTVEASGETGFFYAEQTLRQLAVTGAEGRVSYPCVEIEDAPRYAWRGLMLDESRHFFGKRIGRISCIFE